MNIYIYIYYVHEENTHTILYACMYEVYWWIGIFRNARRAVQIELCRIIEKPSYSSRAVFFHPRNSKNGTPTRKKTISYVVLYVYTIYIKYLIYRRRDVFRKTNSYRFFDKVNNNKVTLLIQMRTIITRYLFKFCNEMFTRNLYDIQTKEKLLLVDSIIILYVMDQSKNNYRCLWSQKPLLLIKIICHESWRRKQYNRCLI